MTTSSFAAYTSINYAAFSVQTLLSVKKFTEKYKGELSPRKLAIYLYSLSGEISMSCAVKVRVHDCMWAPVHVGVHKCHEFFSEQSICSSPEVTAGSQGDGSSVLVNRRDDELSLLNEICKGLIELSHKYSHTLPTWPPASPTFLPSLVLFCLYFPFVYLSVSSNCEISSNKAS